ncbi:ABC transporter ATP-binding protein [Paracoccus aestuarii]|uniref:ABC transporter ATP-binding protein n=1 Tax=Paracoccus aestuarii TaxID=453842 RepID=A0A418ZYA3_9RHOB|nr:ABC transporter ATP-binding protein [Paracoccus aestuarii]RJL05514.1 ABC transporter ATP-binding protein [Paracoccus aestuarii]WCQ98619.1 ABC transporter ATP-binding protein [Paracoccus aestuarii]
MTAALELKQVTASYGHGSVLHDVDLEVVSGKVTALLGANGAGKTTALRAICGMIRTSGDVRLFGEKITGKSPEAIVRMGLAHVPDGRGTFAGLTVMENLRLGAFTAKRSDFRRTLDQVFGYFPRLKERMNQQAGTLSGGEQQMLALGRALMATPRLILLDEPSIGLAPVIVKQLFGILEDIARNEGVSMLLVEQNSNLALKLAENAALLEVGHVVARGSARELAENKEIARAYLGHDSADEGGKAGRAPRYDFLL